MELKRVWLNAVGQAFEVNFRNSLSDLVAYKMYLQKPDGTEAEKTNVTKSGTKLYWTSQTNDFDQVGEYSLQPWIDDGIFQGRREPVKFLVLENQDDGGVQ
jgi:hypothetical protein